MTENENDITNFDISLQTVNKLNGLGITSLYPVQSETFSHIINGEDVVALAKTGTGKTLAFAIPIVDMLQESKNYEHGRLPRTLVLAPTRELVNQIAAVFTSICSEDLKIVAIYGGVSYGPQVQAFRAGVDVVVATPGRMIDLQNSNRITLDCLKYVVLDEVDRMLDMGFSADVETILKNVYNINETSKPQTLIFSATLPKWVSEISKKYVSKSAYRAVLVSANDSRTSEFVEHLALLCPYTARGATISDIIRVYSHGETGRCIVFCETKKDADELASHSSMASDCHVFHGDVPQDKRELVLEKFRDGKYRTLITTNVAARGIDIPDVDLVIQCSPPKNAEDYIHRSGRTGRAGRKGVSVVFYAMKQKQQLSYIEHGAGITFRRIAAPSTKDIVDAWGTDLLRSFLEIPESTWVEFLPAARNLVSGLSGGNEVTMKKKKKKSKKDAVLAESVTSDLAEPSHLELNGNANVSINERALCCALAKIAGRLREIETRSLLTAHLGKTAYQLKMADDYEIYRKGLAYSVLGRQLPPQVTDSIASLTFTKGRTGFVFDLPSEHDQLVLETWTSQDNVTLEKLTVLPELEPEADDTPAYGGRNGFRGRGGFHRGGGFQRGGRGFGHRGSNGPPRGRGNFNSSRGFQRGRGNFGSSFNGKRPGSDFTQNNAKVMKFEE